ncbi:MAG: response regulator [Bacteroidales bacterium]|jgi:CheY-like chemotaxis protein|nr:response regulator [Bacteroidales bacterium]
MEDKLIFFVDDEPMFINLLEYTFKCRDGYTTKAFNNGEECVKHLDLNPDLVVVDFFLENTHSEMSGLDVVREVRRIKPTVPVIILSGNNEENAITAAKEAGVIEYIVKDGYFIDNLIECIARILPAVK